MGRLSEAIERIADQAGDQPLDRDLQFGGSAAEMPQKLGAERHADFGCRSHGCSSMK
jgi:hypothetical protein